MCPRHTWLSQAPSQPPPQSTPATQSPDSSRWVEREGEKQKWRPQLDTGEENYREKKKHGRRERRRRGEGGARLRRVGELGCFSGGRRCDRRDPGGSAIRARVRVRLQRRRPPPEQHVRLERPTAADVEDAIWAEFNESEDHIVPYPKGEEDNTLVGVGDHKNHDEEAASIVGITERFAEGQTEFQEVEKQPANETSVHFSATRLDMESWPDLPSLNPTLDRNYSDDNIASTYLDFNAEPSLQKVTGNTTCSWMVNRKCLVMIMKKRVNSFLDCDWGNIGDFDDFDRLFSSSDSIFGNEMVANGSDFLSTSSDLMDNTVQSLSSPLVPLNKQLSSDCGPSSNLINETSDGIIKQENKVADANAKSGEEAENKNHLTCEYLGKPNQFSQEGDLHKRPVRSRRKAEERGKSKVSSSTSGLSRSKGHNPPASLQAPMQPVQTPQYALFHDGKNMGQVQHPNQFMFPAYGYPAYPFPPIPGCQTFSRKGITWNQLLQATELTSSCMVPARGGLSTGLFPLSNTMIRSSPAYSREKKKKNKPPNFNRFSKAFKPKHSSSMEKSLTMTPQEKIEKLRRRQQMQALIAIQQQQQQFGQEASGSDTIVPQPYSPRNKNLDSLGSSTVTDENANKVVMPELLPTSHDEVHKSSAISDDPFIEEKIYFQLQDALGKLDTRTRLCIRDSLLRLAHSATERQIAGDRSSTNTTNKDEDDTSENDTSSRRKRSPAKEAETNTNPIDRIVAHLLFHRHSSKVAIPTKEEIMSSTPLTREPGSKMPLETPREPSEGQRNEQEILSQPSQ
ncbi:hypothetical protein ACP70R_033622 [Stipagrostis hirtigluma subsp. patula]